MSIFALSTSSNKNPQINTPIAIAILLLQFFLIHAAAAQTATQHFEIPNTQVVNIEDGRFERSYQLFIKLPNSYSKDDFSEHYYPVIYLTDALTAFPLVSSTTQVPMNAGKMEEAITVGISWQMGISPIDSRVRDYTPTIAADWARTTGGADAHLNFLNSVVFPYIENNFRADAGQRIFSGHSLGGLFGAYILSRKPDTFYGYILGSPSLWFDNKYLLKLTPTLQITEAFSAVKVFLGVGSLESPQYSGAANDLVKDTRQYYAQLNALGKNSTTLQIQLITGAIHETAYPATVAQGLNWILGK